MRRLLQRLRIEQLLRIKRRRIAAIGIVLTLLGTTFSGAGSVWAEERDKPVAVSNKALQPVKEHTRIHTKTGLPVRVRSYFRQVVEPKAVAVRSHFRNGHLVKGHERKQPKRDKTKETVPGKADVPS